MDYNITLLQNQHTKPDNKILKKIKKQLSSSNIINIKNQRMYIY